MVSRCNAVRLLGVYPAGSFLTVSVAGRRNVKNKDEWKGSGGADKDGLCLRDEGMANKEMGESGED